MKTLVSSLLLLGFLAACEAPMMDHGMADDGMASNGAAAMDDQAMDHGMGAMAGG